MEIRFMEERDLDQVTALEAACFSQPWKRNDFEDILTNPDRFYMVAADGDVIAGGCMLSCICGEGDISNVAVLEAYRNRHIATELLREMLRFGTGQMGLVAYTLEVRQQNLAAQGLYKKLGFVSEGVRPNFYDFPKDHAVIMWKRDVNEKEEKEC